jgi:hypothetical protein
LSRIEEKRIPVVGCREDFHSEISTGGFPQAQAIHEPYADKSFSSANVLASDAAIFLFQNGAQLCVLV